MVLQLPINLVVIIINIFPHQILRNFSTPPTLPILPTLLILSIIFKHLELLILPIMMKQIDYNKNNINIIEINNLYHKLIHIILMNHNIIHISNTKKKFQINNNHHPSVPSCDLFSNIFYIFVFMVTTQKKITSKNIYVAKSTATSFLSPLISLLRFFGFYFRI